MPSLRLLTSPLVALAVFLAACSASEAESEVSIAEFRKLLSERAMAEIPGVKTRALDANSMEVIWPGGEKAQLDVRHGYESYLREPERRDYFLGRLVQGAIEQKDGALAPNRDRLVAVVRSKQLLQDLGARSEELLVKPVAGDLIQALAIDADHSLSYVTKRDLEALGLSEPEAWRIAIENLPRRIGEFRTEQIEDTGAIGVSAESGLAVSLILDPRTCGPATPQGQDGQIIQVMDREFFATSINRYPQSIPAFWRLNAVIKKAGDGYSTTPITCRDGRWVVATPPKG